MASSYKMKGIFKGFKIISQIFAAKEEQEMEIGSPTDVKHVAHIGWNSSTLPPMTNASPSFRMDASALGISCDFSSLGNLAPSAAAATSWASSQAVSENTAQDAGGAAPDMPPAGESPVDSSMSEDSVASASLAPTAAASDEAVGASGRLLQ
ncbi:hypothetical protein BRADI_5g22600v3 [Brachypodium distachyon]|uniref:CRIB domain-containing protein n=1 Tax=Brachypodium distachyon TaxID=15368 RepID=A0A2K2CIQ3_BRADI|nr:hypothetical protein BRADI_5g22600v3 [Brachypodium distachyon]